MCAVDCCSSWIHEPACRTHRSVSTAVGSLACVGSEVVRIATLTLYPGRMSYKATKPGLVSVLYLRTRYTVLLFIRAPFYVLLVFVAICSVFWLFWLSYQYLLSGWLERLL